jgi:molybdopterin-synthase adenylyltransferase
MSIYFHERLYRSAETMSRLAGFRVTICGAGALGANIAESLARSGFAALRVVDRDRVEERNLSTQPYHRSDVGAMKAKVLSNGLYRAVAVAVDARAEELTPSTAGKLLGGSDLVVDAFDNSGSRETVSRYCDAAGTPCLHAGLSPDYAEVIWNDAYRIPSPVNDDVCDYPLARNLVMLAAAVACEVIVAFADSGERPSFTITLADLSVRPFA